MELLDLDLRRRERCRLVATTSDLEGALSLVWRPEWREVALIGDETVVGLHGGAVAHILRGRAGRVEVLSFPPGEQHKVRRTKERLEDRLVELGFDRGCCIVALGGGITMDLAGYVAATFLRGVAHLNLPTSLLAQADAAIGGKTGLNTARGKNLIGAIHQPAAVVLCSELLATLPPREWTEGLVEVVKHAVIADRELFEHLEARADALRRGELDPDVLFRTARIKCGVVEADEREQGLRSVLNLGHTIGHALEMASGHRVRHGRAVAVGLAVEARVAIELSGLPEGEARRVTELLCRLQALERPPVGFDDIVPYLERDKKHRDGQVRMALPRRIGCMDAGEGRYTLAGPETAARRAWRQVEAPA
jgi:3-dehydroquinate synthase